MASLNDLVPSGVITGEDCLKLFEHARANSYAIPAINCTVSERVLTEEKELTGANGCATS